MTIVQLVDAFTFYGVDVIFLASLTTVLIQLIKKPVRKSTAKKLLTFLPFLIGTALYAAYTAICAGSVKIILHEYIPIVEHGLSVGALSTVIYVLYEQFVRGKTQKTLAAAVCENLLEGYIADNLSEVAAEVAEIVSGNITETAAQKVRAKIAENAAEGIDEREIILLAKAVVDTLSHIN